MMLMNSFLLIALFLINDDTFLLNVYSLSIISNEIQFFILTLEYDMSKYCKVDEQEFFVTHWCKMLHDCVTPAHYSSRAKGQSCFVIGLVLNWDYGLRFKSTGFYQTSHLPSN